MRNAIIWGSFDLALLIYWGIYFAVINPTPSAFTVWLVTILSAGLMAALVINLVTIYMEVVKRKTKKYEKQTEQIIRGRLEDKQTGEVVQITSPEQLRDILERKMREATDGRENGGDNRHSKPGSNGRLPF